MYYLAEYSDADAVEGVLLKDYATPSIEEILAAQEKLERQNPSKDYDIVHEDELFEALDGNAILQAQLPEPYQKLFNLYKSMDYTEAEGL